MIEQIEITELDEIEAKAKAATQDAWVYMGLVNTTFPGEIRSCEHFSLIADMPDMDDREADFEHIARMDPPTTLRLVSNLREYMTRCVLFEIVMEGEEKAIVDGMMKAHAERETLRGELAEMERRKDGAYEERNKVVAALARVFPSGVAKTAIEGWSEDWHGCVYIDLPTGQVSWHFHDSQAHLFAGLPEYKKPWDGHDTPEKYRRLAALNTPKGR